MNVFAGLYQGIMQKVTQPWIQIAVEEKGHTEVKLGTKMVQKFRKYNSQSAVNQFIEIREFQVAYRCQIGLKAERDITAFNNCK